MSAGRTRGAIAVEFALLLPLLLVLVGGAIAWGHVLAREVALVAVARDAALAGARVASADNPDAVALARAREGLAAAGLDSPGATVSVTRRTLPVGEAIRVQVTLPVDPLLNLVPLPTTLTSVTVTRLDDQ